MRKIIRSHVRHRGFSAADLLWFLLFLLLLFAILLPSLARAREQAKKAVCSSNLRGLGQGLHIYANDNREWFPAHYFKPEYEPVGDLVSHGVSWVGTMGTNDFLSITEFTSSEKSPTRSHPSRSLFLTLIAGSQTTGQFVCPSSSDVEDDLHNYGPDAKNQKEEASRPGRTRFDFRGYTNLSYGYQLPYGKYGRPRETLDPRVVIMADKGPYYEVGDPGVPGTRTFHDRLSGVEMPDEWKKPSPEDLTVMQQQWGRFNSRNHNGEGQNVLFVDSHVDFVRTPLAGVYRDNIYTIQAGYNTMDALIGIVPGAEDTYGPLTQTDSYLVP